MAVKVVKSAKSFMETAIDEIKLLKWAKNSDPLDQNRRKIVLLLDDFVVKSINGTHICMVFEVLGISLLQLIVQNGYQGIPIPMVRTVVRQVSQAIITVSLVFTNFELADSGGSRIFA